MDLYNLAARVMDRPNDRTVEEEMEYRRGYCDGFEAAVDAIQDQMEKRGALTKDFEQVSDYFWDFRYTKLKKWRYKRPDYFYFPPRP